VLSTSLAALPTSFWYLPRLALRVVGRDWRWAVDLSRQFMPFALLLLPVAGLGRAWAAAVGGYPGAAAGALLTAVWGLALLWRMLLDRGAKSSLEQVLRSRFVSPRSRGPVVPPLTHANPGRGI
jgi:hypothetical protein